jgi:hypothetical protein
MPSSPARRGSGGERTSGRHALQARAGARRSPQGWSSLLLHLRGRQGWVLGHGRLDRPRRLLNRRWLLRGRIVRRVSRWFRLARRCNRAARGSSSTAISSRLSQDFSLPKAKPGSVLRFTPQPGTMDAPRSTRAAGPLPPRGQRQAYRSLLARRLFAWRINRSTWWRSTLSASMTFCVTDP